MSFQINKGLFTLDFVDHHAILGLPIGADPQDVRKRYIKVARRLHPDSFITASEADKQLASQLFGKLINPAYDELFIEAKRKEYLLNVGYKSQQAFSEKQRFPVSQFCEEARKLIKVPNLESEYRQAVKAMADKQFDDLALALESIGHLSELNLIYLVRKEAAGAPRPYASATPPPPPPPAGQPQGQPPTTTMPTHPPTPRPLVSDPGGDTTIIQNDGQRTSIVDGYLRRAQEYLNKKAYAQALLELRDGIRVAPKDSRCHSLTGLVYLRQNQATMARVSIKRALELNLQDPTALECRRQLEKAGHKIELGSSGSGSSTMGTSTTSANIKGKGKGKDGGKESGGLFGGFFGGKKK
jgi:curved DNA-binding protein CbpA